MENQNPPVAAPVVPADVTPLAPAKASFPVIAIIIIVTLLLAGTGALAYWFGTQSKPQPTISNIIPSPAPTTAPTNEARLTTPTPTGDIDWQDKPQVIASLALFKADLPKNDALYLPNQAKYYLVGTKKDQTQIINAYIPVNGPGGEQFLRILKSTNNNLTILIPSNENGQWLQESLAKEINPGIEILTETIADIDPPETITISQGKLTKAYYNGRLFSDLVAPEKITDTESGPLYRVNTAITDRAVVSTRQINLKLKDGTVVPYEYQIPIVTDDKNVLANWSDVNYQGKTFTQSIVGGCGINETAASPIIRRSFTVSDKVVVGQTTTGTPVYKIAATNTAFVTEFYNEYKLGRDYPGSTQKILTREEFAASPYHFIWQDGLGDWQVFVDQDMAPMVECGKPVIYLYPEKTTRVQVKVGAKIRLSDPAYPSTGWNVIAKPSGELTYQDQTYPYLFWEGLGEGYYPDYHDRGVIVSQNKLLTILRSQLTQLGLTSQESTDFMTFWQPKLPTTPYIRLTWLGTTDMDRLAPLRVDPKPDTKIRIFLEFEGLQSPRNLKPQTLSAPERRGFTLIEWGGLLLRPRT